MAYSRPPVQPGRALSRTPAAPVESSAGVFDFALDADIATTTNLGVVQVGSGLAITSAGILSAIGGTGLISVILTAFDYTALFADYYIGAISKDIEITLPLGVVGKTYYIKNQANGNIKVKGTSGQTLDTATSKTLGSEAAIICVFDGTRWNII